MGRSISIADLQSIGGIKANFDLYQYAIAITIPNRSATEAMSGSNTPIDLDGLPTISTGKIGIGAIQQRSNVSGATNDLTRTSGELRAVGSIDTGSWQVRIEPRVDDDNPNVRRDERHRSIEELALFGQVSIVPFFDRNGNARQDVGEEGYFALLLIEINRKSLRDVQAQTNGLISTLQLAPGSYRIDLNPAGYPISYRSKSSALHISLRRAHPHYLDRKSPIYLSRNPQLRHLVRPVLMMLLILRHLVGKYSNRSTVLIFFHTLFIIFSNYSAEGDPHN